MVEVVVSFSWFLCLSCWVDCYWFWFGGVALRVRLVFYVVGLLWFGCPAGWWGVRHFFVFFVFWRCFSISGSCEL